MLAALLLFILWATLQQVFGLLGVALLATARG